MSRKIQHACLDSAPDLPNNPAHVPDPRYQRSRLNIHIAPRLRMQLDCLAGECGKSVTALVQDLLSESLLGRMHSSIT